MQCIRRTVRRFAPRLRLRGVLLVSLVTLASSSACLKQTYECTRADQCVASGRAGRCEQDGHCSFPDDFCPSGFRYAAAPQGDICTDVLGSALGGTGGMSGTAGGPVVTGGIPGGSGLAGTGIGQNGLAGNGVVGDGPAGSGSAGQTTGSTAGGPPARALAGLTAGGDHTCLWFKSEGVESDGGDTDGGPGDLVGRALVCFGLNENGQLLDGFTSARGPPGQVAQRHQAEQVTACMTARCQYQRVAPSPTGRGRLRCP